MHQKLIPDFHLISEKNPKDSWCIQEILPTQKVKFFIKGFFSKYYHIRKKIWSHILKKFFIENFVLCEVSFVNKISWERIIKNLKISNLSFVFGSNLFFVNIRTKTEKGSGTSYQSLLRLPNIKKFSFFRDLLPDQLWSFMFWDTLFYKNSIFKVILSMLTKLLLSALFYAYNMYSIMEFVMVALRSNRGHWPKWKTIHIDLAFYFYKNWCMCDKKKTSFNFSLAPFSNFFPTILKKFSLYTFLKIMLVEKECMQKITINNLCKPFHNGIIITYSTSN